MEYEDFLKGKKVALYCPSPQLDKKATGKLINQCDIVIGTNNSIFRTMNTASVGNSLDVVYHNFSHYKCENLVFNEKMWQDFYDKGGKWIVTGRNSSPNKYPEEYRLIRNMIEEIGLNFRDLRSTDFLKINSMCKKYPTTGLYALYDLLQYDCEIYVFGMFHPRVPKRKLTKGYTRLNRMVSRGKSRKHNFENEGEVLLKLAQIYRDKLKLDPLAGKLSKRHINYRATRFHWDKL